MQLNWLDATTETLSEGFPEDLVILDCETTGGKATYHRITEIGLLIVHKGNVVERWQSFVNPEAHIPANIQALTGITQAMVASAPLFKDIADELIEILTGRTLVAHFARFDYGFLKNEFARVGINYSSKPLCSVKFSRAMFPQFRHHGLDAIIKRFNFTIVNRHRAQDDAEIIYKLFLKSSTLFSPEDIAAACQKLLKRPALPIAISSETIDKIPDTPGVYYFYDNKGQILYIGKSLNIKTRVLSHFTQDYKNPKDLTLIKKIAHIDYQTTPTDFGAQILESQEIKAQSPFYNRRLKKIKKLFQVKTYEQHGILRVKIETINTDTIANIPGTSHHGLFKSQRQALEKLRTLADNNFLCTQTMGIDGDTRISHNNRAQNDANPKIAPCFRYQLRKCLGACCNIEPIANHNQRLQIALANYQMQVWPYPDAILIEEKSPTQSHTAYHLINNWCYLEKIKHPNDIYDYGFSFEPQAPSKRHNHPINNKIAHTPPANNPSELENHFNFDTYFILARFLLKPAHRKQITIHPLIRS